MQIKNGSAFKQREELEYELACARQPSLRDSILPNDPEYRRKGREYNIFTLCSYIDSLRYYDKPNYAIIRGLLRDALTSNALSEFPYDWELDQSKLPDPSSAAATTPPNEAKLEKPKPS
ncbi:hypothetical protein COOONC_12138 [Cooperia oncophora]